MQQNRDLILSSAIVAAALVFAKTSRAIDGYLKIDSDFYFFAWILISIFLAQIKCVAQETYILDLQHVSQLGITIPQGLDELFTLNWMFSIRAVLAVAALATYILAIGMQNGQIRNVRCSLRGRKSRYFFIPRNTPRYFTEIQRILSFKCEDCGNLLPQAFHGPIAHRFCSPYYDSTCSWFGHISSSNQLWVIVCLFCMSLSSWLEIAYLSKLYGAVAKAIGRYSLAVLMLGRPIFIRAAAALLVFVGSAYQFCLQAYYLKFVLSRNGLNMATRLERKIQAGQVKLCWDDEQIVVVEGNGPDDGQELNATQYAEFFASARSTCPRLEKLLWLARK